MPPQNATSNGIGRGEQGSDPRLRNTGEFPRRKRAYYGTPPWITRARLMPDALADRVWGQQSCTGRVSRIGVILIRELPEDEFGRIDLRQIRGICNIEGKVTLATDTVPAYEHGSPFLGDIVGRSDKDIVNGRRRINEILVGIVEVQ